MSDTYKFPNNGYEVTVCKKQDIIDCINANIIDKDIAFAIVSNLEKQVAKLIQEGFWTGIPFIGNVRIPKGKQLEQTEEQQALISEAKNTLDRTDYLLFRTRLGKENARKIKSDRYYNYIASISANHNKKLYRKLLNEKGESYCTVYFNSIYNLTYIAPNEE